MSLILEALRKLERDRPQEGQRGSVVLLAPRPWPESNERRRRAWILGGAAAGGLVLLGLVGLGSGWLTTRARPAAATVPTSATPAPAPITGAPAVPTPLAPVASTPEGSADAVRRTPRPTATARPRPLPTPPVFHLTAIGDRDGHPVAVLNDRVLRVGDGLEGAQILSIGDASVELRLVDGRQITVSF